MQHTDKLLEFISFTHEVRKIKRALLVRDEDQYENDSEHSFQLALTALYVIEERKLNLNAERCMSLAVVHDILEVYSGDTPVFGSQEHIDTKVEREAKAKQRLRENWPNHDLMHSLIDEYEARQTNESKFVYALDKILPIFNNYLDNGRTWKKNNITMEQHIRIKSSKTEIDPIIHAYHKDIMQLLQEKPDLFPS